jgi:hypothetical protein
MRVEVAKKLLAVFQKTAETPEGQAAGRQLTRMLEESNSTLRALDASFPDHRELAAMLTWRESLGWLAALEGDGKDAALEKLVDASDLSSDERRQVLTHLSLPALAASRVHGWSHMGGLEANSFIATLNLLREEDVLTSSAVTIAEALKDVAWRHAWAHEHPWRELKASDVTQAYFLLGLVRGIASRDGQMVHDDAGFRVRAQLSAQELSKLRSLQATHSPELPDKLNKAAFNFAQAVVKGSV